MLSWITKRETEGNICDVSRLTADGAHPEPSEEVRLRFLQILLEVAKIENENEALKQFLDDLIW